MTGMDKDSAAPLACRSGSDDVAASVNAAMNAGSDAAEPYTQRQPQTRRPLRHQHTQRR
jgi:hypothetical protein